MAKILKEYAGRFVAEHPGQAPPQVQSALAKLSLCRTAALGGRTLQCSSCNYRAAVYHSCGDRHCPQCRGARRTEWAAGASQLLLPGVDYFQVVFTLPEELSALALGNRRPLYNLLFTSAWRALREVIEEQCGFQPAALLVLHTWNQRLEHHPHVHALVPGGGPALRGRRWIASRHPRHRRKRKPYLVDNRLLGERFREQFLAGIERLRQRGELRLPPEGEGSAANLSAMNLSALLADLATRPWVVFIEAPPTRQSPPENVLKYLARYLTGGPISDRRLISHADDKVTFRARSLAKPAAGERPAQVPVRLGAVEFVRRWSLHILPKRFTKVRRYGGYSNRRRAKYLQRCRGLLGQGRESEAAEPDAQNSTEPSPTEDRCPRCRAALTCLWAIDRPGWSVVMAGPARPLWYRHR